MTQKWLSINEKWLFGYQKVAIWLSKVALCETKKRLFSDAYGKKLVQDGYFLMLMLFRRPRDGSCLQ